jgi:hypothetical protein
MALRAVGRVVLARPLLAILLFSDAVLISLHIWAWSAGLLDKVPQLNIERLGSASEDFNYVKWLFCCLGCLWLFSRKRESLYLLWAALFFYFLIDDAEAIRYPAGAWIQSVMGWRPALALTGQDFGELAAACTAAAVLLPPIALRHRASDNAEARTFSWSLFPWLVVLLIFGVGVDMFHAMIGESSTFSIFVGVVEDGGEMVAGSVLTAIICQAVLALMLSPTALQPVNAAATAETTACP